MQPIKLRGSGPEICGGGPYEVSEQLVQLPFSRLQLFSAANMHFFCLTAFSASNTRFFHLM